MKLTHFLTGIGAAFFAAVAALAANATDYGKAERLGLVLGKNHYSDDVKQFFASVDAAFDKHDYPAFVTLMRSPGNGPRVLASLDWAQGNMLMGAGVAVSTIYAESLWSIGSTAPAGSPYVNYKETATFVTLYSLGVTATDGPKCADHSAPDSRFPKISSHFEPVLAFLRQLPDDKKQQVVNLALTYEDKLSPLRSNDNYLCRFGLEEIGEGLKGKRVEDLPQRPAEGNEVGTQVLVPSPPGYEPKFVAESEWRPKQIEMRARLPAIFANLIKPLPTRPKQ